VWKKEKDWKENVGKEKLEIISGLLHYSIIDGNIEVKLLVAENRHTAMNNYPINNHHVTNCAEIYTHRFWSLSSANTKKKITEKFEKHSRVGVVLCRWYHNENFREWNFVAFPSTYQNCHQKRVQNFLQFMFFHRLTWTTITFIQNL
jgi:hypothetical protein